MALSSINRVIIVGNLTRDPELRSLPSGLCVCHLRVACNGRRRTEDGGWAERPNYFDVSVFGPHGENSKRYLRKGRAVAIDGRLEWREWEATGQPKRQSVSIIADTVQFLGGPDTRPAAGSSESSAAEVPTATGETDGSAVAAAAEAEAEAEVGADEAELASVASGPEDEGDELSF